MLGYVLAKEPLKMFSYVSARCNDDNIMFIEYYKDFMDVKCNKMPIKRKKN